MKKTTNIDTRMKDVEWCAADSKTGIVPTWGRVQVAVLMDLRDELKKLNALLHCHNALAIPDLLRAIKKNTTKKKRRARKAVTP